MEDSTFVVKSLTSSPSLARAGSKVGGGSLWLSMPSNTKTNLRFTSMLEIGTRPFKIIPSSTTNCARLSQRPIAPPQSTAFATAPTVCSSKCLPVMHSALLTIANSKVSSAPSCDCSFCAACGDKRANVSRTAFTVALLPVASRPYTTKFLCGVAWV
jgi:hypothetical protein